MTTTVNVYVDPDASGANNGTSWANAYTALQTAETANDVDITAATGNDTIVIFHCKSSGGSADTPCIIGGFVTAAANYVQVQGGYAASENGTPGTPQYPGKYSTSYYHIEYANTQNGLLYLTDNHCRIDKVLASSSSTGTGGGVCFTLNALSADNDIRFTDCIAKAGTYEETSADARGWNCLDSDQNVTIVNCIATGFINGADVGFIGFYQAGGGVVNIYNSLAYGCYLGFRELAGTMSVYNSVSFGNADDWYGGITLDYCASDDGGGTNEVSGNEADATWSTDFLDAANGDFTLLVGSPLIGAGSVDPSGAGYGSPSINGVVRGAAWDVGPWEYVAAGSFSSSVSASPSVSISSSVSSSASSSPSPSLGYEISGSTCWGHVTGVLETNTRAMAANWTGTGDTAGSGDTDAIFLGSGEYMESEIVETGVRSIQLLINEYATGDSATIKYKNGGTVAACNADSWNTYSVPFTSDGYVKVRLDY